MKITYLLSVFLVHCVLSSIVAARTWTSSDGRTIEAELVCRTDDSVVLMMKGAKQVVIPVDRLSNEDRAFSDVLKLDFKGINFGDELRTAIKKYPALLSSGDPMVCCLRQGDFTISLPMSKELTVAKVKVTSLAFSFAVPGSQSYDKSSDPSGVVAYSALPSSIKNKALVTRFYSAICDFDRVDYDQFKAALIVKYGKPANIKNEEKQNGLGSKFVSEKCTWDLNGAYATLVERDRKIDVSNFMITCTALMPALKSSELSDAKDL